MTESLHMRGRDSLIPSREKQTLAAYAEALSDELPEICTDCPAAYLCALALLEDTRYSFPRTPSQVRNMKIKQGESSWSGVSGDAQFALKSIVRDANERGVGPSAGGDKCCLDPETIIDINKDDPYR
jgi:hypothetical protein